MKPAKSEKEVEQAEERKIAAEKLGIAEGMVHTLQEIRRLGVSDEEAISVLEELLKQQRAKQAEFDESVGSASFRECVEQRFTRTGRPSRVVPTTSPGPVRNPDHRRRVVASEIEQERKIEPAPEERYRYTERRVWESRDPDTRIFLAEEYAGRCQICGDRNAFSTRSGRPYFEAKYIAELPSPRWMDRPGNCFSLCATCCAKMSHGSVEGVEIVERILSLQLQREGGGEGLELEFELCGESVSLRFTERHLLDLQELLDADDEPGED